MHGLCERVGVGMESSSPPPYIVVEGVRGAEIQPTKHAATKQGKHVPTKHGENMFPCPWCSPMGPHLPPNTLHHLWRLPPTMGGPQHLLSSHKGLPPKGRRPKTAPTSRGILSPHAGIRCFPRLLLLKNSGRSQNISGTL